MKQISDKSIDCIICDPPYGVTDCKWDNVIPLHDMWNEFSRIIKPDGTVVLFSAEPFTTDVIISNRRNFKYKWYWIKSNKTGAPFAKVQPMRQVEEILVFYKKHGTYNPQGVYPCMRTRDRKKAKSNIYTIRGTKEYVQTQTGYPSNVLQFPKDAHCVHPTQKPLALIEYLIKTYTNEGETVLDPCIGSGTTAVAAVNTGRHFIGFETDKNYFDAAQNRIRAAQEERKRNIE